VQKEKEKMQKVQKEKQPSAGMRNAGIGLTLAGLGVGTLAMVLVGSGGSSDQYAGGMAVMGLSLGGLLVLTGIPLWAIGAARYNGAPSSASAAGISLAFGPASAAVAGRF
jgi:hypothetical protein